ncbi:GGDEF domain-containing protein [Alkalicella caledoniensis]|uniref:GGDEF domain-containing protein n=1 Tax=Alkalicella caledoniensis TaxID=2731377 RepID=A0A7G9WAU4_ALKCA|nr:GGDEF domain-containing protein [Alkalicella caledoniensis]QNO15806.1 GGDEF domain-containing protein [Alkalicella caledoniensis]
MYRSINISTKEPLLAQKYKLIETVTSQLAKALENAIIHHSVEVLATTDNLTGFYNNRYFYEALEREIIKSQKNKTELTLVTLDIDDFKIFNDRYGHLIGDYVLKEISNIIHKGTRESDILCRYGGDELFIILPETDSKSAAILMKRIVENIEKHSVEIDREIGLEYEKNNEKNQKSSLGLGHIKSWLSKFNTKKKLTGNIQVTVSVGICSIENIDSKYRNNNDCIKTQLIKKADKAMLGAKHKGKNQVVNA